MLSFSLPSIPPLLLHSLISVLSLSIPYYLHLPSLLLHSLHTYIHPDHLPSSSSSSSSSSSVAIRRPSQDPLVQKPRSKSRPSSSSFDESKAQLLRLRLSHSLLLSRPFFSSFLLSSLLSSLSLSNLSLLLPLTHSRYSPLFLSLSSLLALVYLLSSQIKHAHLPILLPGLAGFVSSLLLLSFPNVFDFQLDYLVIPAVLAGIVAGFVYSAAVRSARSFWLGTDQLRWNLAVVSSGPLGRILLYLSAVFTATAPLLWFNPVGSGLAPSGIRNHRVGILLVSAVLQVLALRPNLQMYLNEAVLCWYQRLHSARAPDLDYARAKVFLHNHYVCTATVQFLGPPLTAMILIGIALIRGNLFSGVLSFDDDCSDAVKGCALFLAWWLVFVQGLLMMGNVGLFRFGLLFVS